ncbi:MAG: hypothetical protein Q4B94_00135 [Pseudomonadota bacterium]|nr:hypothetical protein [Pseudomonadota bacterium]
MQHPPEHLLIALRTALALLRRHLGKDATLLRALYLVETALQNGGDKQDIERSINALSGKSSRAAASRNVHDLTKRNSRKQPGVDMLTYSTNAVDMRRKQLALTDKGERLIDEVIVKMQAALTKKR